MISGLRTYSRLVAVAAAVPLLGASVTGRVELKNAHQTSAKKRQDDSGVVVWLLPSAGRRIVRSDGKHALMIQKDKTFNPHVLAIQTGTTVDFPNYDPIFHNAFSNFSGQIFDIGLYAPGSSRSIRFQRPGVVRIFCNIHPTMSALIMVVDTPYFSVSSRDGHFEIANVPSGDYQLNLFYERAKDDVLSSLDRKITVASDGLNLAPIQISEAGYLPAAHKNKYGKDYPKTVDDGIFYSGGSN